MITITTNHDWATSVDDLRQGLLNTINDQLEEYEPEEGEQQVGFKAEPVEYDLDALLSVEEIDEMWVLRRNSSSTI